MNSFTKTILENSQAVYWGAARHEWQWVGFHDLKEPSGRCICDAPIRYEFVLRNVHTGLEVTAGSACVRNFETPMSEHALSASGCFKDLLGGNVTRRMNESLQLFAKNEKLMSAADARYYEQHGRTRHGTNRFVDARISKINLDFLSNLDPERPNCQCDQKRFRNLKGRLRRSSSGKLFYSCQRGRKGCKFFAWR